MPWSPVAVQARLAAAPGTLAVHAAAVSRGGWCSVPRAVKLASFAFLRVPQQRQVFALYAEMWKNLLFPRNRHISLLELASSSVVLGGEHHFFDSIFLCDTHMKMAHKLASYTQT